MIRTRNFVIPLIGLGVVAGLVLPPVFGLMAQKAVEARVTALDSRPGLDVRLESYARGWFSSTARLAFAASRVPQGASIGPSDPPPDRPANGSAPRHAASSRDGASAGASAGTRAGTPAFLLGLLPTAADPAEVLVDIDHGPISFRHGFFFGFAQISAGPALAARGPSGAPAAAFRFVARVDLDGAWHFVAELPALERTAPTGGVSLSGARVFGSVQRRHLTAQGRADTLQIKAPHATLSTVDLTVSADTELLSSRLLPGRIDIEAVRAAIEPRGGEAIDAAHVSVRSRLSVDEPDKAGETDGTGETDEADGSDGAGKGGNAEGAGEADSVSKGGNADGAGKAANAADTGDADGVGNTGKAGRLVDGRMEFAAEMIRSGKDRHITRPRLTTIARHLDLAALEDYSEAAAALAEADGGGAEATAEDRLEQALRRVLAAGPTLEISPLSFDLDGQPFEAEVSASARPEALTGGGPLDLADTSFWSELLRGRARLTAAKTLAHSFLVALVKQRLEQAAGSGPTLPPGEIEPVARAQAGLLLAMASARGMLEDTGNLYKTTLRLEDGRLTINGKPLPGAGR